MSTPASVFTVLQRGLLLISFLILTACNGGGTDSSAAEGQQQLFISGAGIKGPLAFASVELYSLDAKFNRLYDPQTPLATATTNAYAEIKGLKIPNIVQPPYVLVIDGGNAIDRNTGIAPVIKTMVTIITKEALQARRPIYATPYTTLAYHMLRNELAGENALKNTYQALETDLATYNDVLSRALGFDMPASVNIFVTPPIITKETRTLEQQELVINYRAAIEALSSMLHQGSQASVEGVSSDTLLERLAFDLYADGIVDNSYNGQPIDGIDTAILTQNPMTVAIPNTNYLVQDIVSLIDDERALVGSNSNIFFYKEQLAVNLKPALLDSTIDYFEETDYSQSVNNTVNTVLLTSLVSACCPQAQNNVGAIFHTDFNNEELHTYTITDVNEDWDAYDAIVLNGGIAVVNDPDPNGNHGKALRAFYAEGEYGYNGGSGGQWIKSLDGYDELYFAFDIYFESDFDFVKTIKLPSPRSSDWLNNWFIGKPDGTDFWTAGITAESGGELTSYVYHAEQSGTYGDTINWDDGADGLKTYFTPGEWHTVEIRVKINTPGVLDGRLQGWFDGEKRLDTSNLMWRKPGGEGLKIGEYMFYTFFGGDDSSFAPIKDEHIYFDNFVISTQPITH